MTTMPIKKIHDGAHDAWSHNHDPHPCRDREHDPPSMRVFRPGTHMHECPSCHRTVVFHVPVVLL